MKSLPAVFALLFCAPISHACVAVWDNPNQLIVPVDETALIVWDAKKGVEHFIRGARFSEAPTKLGFVVPTPSKPTLTAISGAPFQALEKQIQPEIVTRSEIYYSFLGYWARPRSEEESSDAATARPASEGEVEVVEERRLGQYDAAVLRGRDANAIRNWLARNRFQTSDASEKWLAHYARRNWYFTAFKIASDATQGNAPELSPVRISFRTHTPFYPYRETQSAQKRIGARSLRVFFVGPERVKAHIVAPAQIEVWGARTPYSAPLQNAGEVAQNIALSSNDLNGNWRLTTFEDLSSPRRSFGDLHFSRDADQSELKPAPIQSNENRVVYIPLDLAVVVSGFWLFRLRQRQRPFGELR